MAKNTRMTLNLPLEFAASWTRLWKANLESRLKGHDYGGRTYFLAASEIERELRDELGRRIRAERPDDYLGTLRISGLGGRPLLDHVRSWLRGEVLSGRLEADDRGRGHCSSMRFRPTRLSRVSGREEGRRCPDRREAPAAVRRSPLPGSDGGLVR